MNLILNSGGFGKSNGKVFKIRWDYCEITWRNRHDKSLFIPQGTVSSVLTASSATKSLLLLSALPNSSQVLMHHRTLVQTVWILFIPLSVGLVKFSHDF